MKLVITLGVRYGDAPYPQIEVVTPNEIGWDMVFRAANRIELTGDDLKNLPYEWQQHVRLELDRVGAPSMSVGDTIDVYSEAGVHHLHVTCDNVGWTVDRITEDLA